MVSVGGAGDQWDRYDQLYKKYQEGLKENTELEKELARLKDQQKLIDMKKSAMGGDSQGQTQPKSKEGYQLLHVLLVAIVCLIIGALLNK